jgi:hypothetical protein
MMAGVAKPSQRRTHAAVIRSCRDERDAWRVISPRKLAKSPGRRNAD